MPIPFILGATLAAGVAVNSTAAKLTCGALSALSALPNTKPFTMDDITDTLNINEVAALTKVSTQTIRRKIYAGELNPKKTSNKTGYIFEKSDVLRYAKENNIELDLNAYSKLLPNTQTNCDNSASLIAAAINTPDTFSAKLYELKDKDKKANSKLLEIIHKGLKSELAGLNEQINILNAIPKEEYVSSENILTIAELKKMVAHKEHDIAVCEMYQYEAKTN